MVSILLKSMGYVNVTVHNYHALLDTLKGIERQRVLSIVTNTFGIKTA